MSSGFYFRFAPLTLGHHVNQNASNISVCQNGVQWIWKVLGDCVETPREQASSYLGMVSMAAWLFVVMPQIIRNFRNLEGMAGVSFFLLFQWAGGDVTNLVGALLTKQLKLQIVLACYFVFTDVILLGQYVAYRCVKARKKKAENKAVAADPTPRLILCLMGLALMSCGQIWSSSFSQATGNLQGTYHIPAAYRSRSLLSVVHGESDTLVFQSEQADKSAMSASESGAARNEEYLFSVGSNKTKDKEAVFWHDEVSMIGYSIGIVSSLFYLGSRSAQIYKNVKAQSTEGLAIMTFFLAVIGNLAYGGQILVRDLSSEFLLEKTPWLVGSLGVVGLDCTLLFQFRYYSHNNRNLDDMRRSLLTGNYTIPINSEDYGAPIDQPDVHGGNDYIY